MFSDLISSEQLATKMKAVRRIGCALGAPLWLIRSTEEEKIQQIANVEAFKANHNGSVASPAGGRGRAEGAGEGGVEGSLQRLMRVAGLEPSNFLSLKP